MPRTLLPTGYFSATDQPGVLRLLFHPQRDLLLFPVVLEHDHLDPVAHLERLGGMVDPAPGDVGDVHEPVDAAQVHKRAVVRDVLDHAAHDLPFDERGECRLFFQVLLLLQNRPAGEDDVAAAGVHLDDLQVQGLADELAEVRDRLDVDLGPGKERRHPADIDRQASLDDGQHFSLYRRPGLIRAVQVVPDLQFLRLVAGEHDVPVRVFRLLDKHLELISRFERS